MWQQHLILLYVTSFVEYFILPCIYIIFKFLILISLTFVGLLNESL